MKPRGSTSPAVAAAEHVSLTSRLGRVLDGRALWYLMVAPAIALIALFMVVPILQALTLALYRWNGVRPRQFVGLDNLVDLVSDRFFASALQHTFIFAIAATAGTVLIGLLLAVAISRRVPGSAAYRVLFFLPVMVPITVVGALWVRMLEPNFGPINTALRSVGLDGVALAWLGDSSVALWVLIGVTIWQYCGFPMIVLLAGIENIPEDVQEAATLDGVDERQRLRHITLPLIRPVLLGIAVLQTIFALKVFDLVWVMTRGGPGQSTDVLGTFLFDEAFFKRQFGYASAVAVAMFVIIFVVTFAYQRLARVEDARQ